MKYIFAVLLGIVGIGLSGNSQSFRIAIKNSSTVVLYSSIVQDYGSDAGGDKSISPGQTGNYSFDCGVLTGAEGTLSFNPPNDLQNQLSIHVDNPMIGKAWYFISPFHSQAFNIVVTSFIKSGHTPTLTAEITGGNGIQIKPIPVVLNAKGTLSGTIYWDKRDIAGPVQYPYAQVFTAKLYAPTQFIESNQNITFEKPGTYEGKNGYFIGQKQAGSISYTVQPAGDPNYMEVKYKITGVPTDVPLDFDLQTDYNKSRWTAGPQKPSPGNNYSFLVGTFQLGNNSSLKMNNDELLLDGIDFKCEGEWVQVDDKGNIIGGSPMVNKIETRKTAPVLPGNGMLVSVKTNSNQVMQVPGMQNKTQQVQVQKVRTAGAVKIRQ